MLARLAQLSRLELGLGSAQVLALASELVPESRSRLDRPHYRCRLPHSQAARRKRNTRRSDGTSEPPMGRPEIFATRMLGYSFDCFASMPKSRAVKGTTTNEDGLNVRNGVVLSDGPLLASG